MKIVGRYPNGKTFFHIKWQKQIPQVQSKFSHITFCQGKKWTKVRQCAPIYLNTFKSEICSQFQDILKTKICRLVFIHTYLIHHQTQNISILNINFFLVFAGFFIRIKDALNTLTPSVTFPIMYLCKFSTLNFCILQVSIYM